MLRYFETMAPSTLASISAPSNTPTGACPPSSKPSFFTPTAACWYRILPPSGDPVKPTKRTAGCSHNTLPIADELPVIMLNTPFGTPAFSASATSASAVSGVSLAGLSTTVQPAASAGETLRVIIEHGKFHGVIAPQTPIGALGRNGFAIDPARFLGKELDIGAADVDFAERFGQRLALLGGQDQRE